MNRQKLRELIAKATPGPWRVGLDERGRVQGIWSPAANSAFDDDDEGTQIVETDSGVYPPCAADAEFIATARNALPELLDALDKAEAERDILRAALSVAADRFGESAREFNRECRPIAVLFERSESDARTALAGKESQ